MESAMYNTKHKFKKISIEGPIVIGHSLPFRLFFVFIEFLFLCYSALSLLIKVCLE